MNNYPDGAANDPNAPYNKKDPVMIDCLECEGSGEIEVEIEDGDNIYDEEQACPNCDGFGQIEIENED